MQFTRVLYEDVPEWGLIEGKYARLIDRAPYQEWDYTGLEVRIFKAQYAKMLTGRSITVRTDNSSVLKKSAAKVYSMQDQINCKPEGMELFVGLTMLVEKDNKVFGYAVSGAGILSGIAFDKLDENSTLTVLINGKVERTSNIGDMLKEINKRFNQVIEAEKIEEGDIFTLTTSGETVYAGDTIEVRIDKQVMINTRLKAR